VNRPRCGNAAWRTSDAPTARVRLRGSAPNKTTMDAMHIEIIIERN
jgi:hypothetical protein